MAASSGGTSVWAVTTPLRATLVQPGAYAGMLVQSKQKSTEQVRITPASEAHAGSWEQQSCWAAPHGTSTSRASDEAPPAASFGAPPDETELSAGDPPAPETPPDPKRPPPPPSAAAP